MSEAVIISGIRQIVAERSGLVVQDYDLALMREIVTKRMMATDCSSTQAYLDLLSSRGGAGSEFTEFVKLLTVGHTRFFRNPKQFNALRDVVLPELIARKGSCCDGAVRVLSAGCSTGEEPYSIAMLLMEAAANGCPFPFEIIATDISPDALAAAKSGHYPKSTLRHVDEVWFARYLERFCRVGENGVVVGDSVKSVVELMHMNLFDYEPERTFDIIFCRNVTIYFSKQMTKAILERMCGWLSADGYLFAGASESPSLLSGRFAPVQIGGAVAYRKRTAALRESSTVESNGRRAESSAVARAAGEGCRPRPRTRPSRASTDRDVVGKTERTSGTREVRSGRELCDEAIQRLGEKDHDAAERLARRAMKAFPSLQGTHLLMAQILADQERLEEAEEECRKAIEQDRLSAEPHFLMGLIHRQMAESDEAMADLRRAIYLDPDHSLAHFAMAGLCKDMGLDREARREYRNALRTFARRKERGLGTESGLFCSQLLAGLSDTAGSVFEEQNGYELPDAGR